MVIMPTRMNIEHIFSSVDFFSVWISVGSRLQKFFFYCHRSPGPGDAHLLLLEEGDKEKLRQLSLLVEVFMLPIFYSMGLLKPSLCPQAFPVSILSF